MNEGREKGRKGGIEGGGSRERVREGRLGGRERGRNFRVTDRRSKILKKFENENLMKKQNKPEGSIFVLIIWLNFHCMQLTLIFTPSISTVLIMKSTPMVAPWPGGNMP